MKKTGARPRRPMNPNMSLQMPPNTFPESKLNGTQLDLQRTFNDSNNQFSGSNLLAKLNDSVSKKDEFDISIQVNALTRVLGEESKKEKEIEPVQNLEEYKKLKDELNQKNAMLRNSKLENSVMVESFHKRSNVHKELVQGLEKKVFVYEKVVAFLKSKLEKKSIKNVKNEKLACGINYYYCHRAHIKKHEQNTMKTDNATASAMEGNAISYKLDTWSKKLEKIEQKLHRIGDLNKPQATFVQIDSSFLDFSKIIESCLEGSLIKIKNIKKLKQTILLSLSDIISKYANDFENLNKKAEKKDKAIEEAVSKIEQFQLALEKKDGQIDNLEKELKISSAKIEDLENSIENQKKEKIIILEEFESLKKMEKTKSETLLNQEIDIRVLTEMIDTLREEIKRVFDMEVSQEQSKQKDDFKYVFACIEDQKKKKKHILEEKTKEMELMSMEIKEAKETIIKKGI